MRLPIGYSSILHRFRDIDWKGAKSLYSATPLVFNFPNGGVPGTISVTISVKFFFTKRSGMAKFFLFFYGRLWFAAKKKVKKTTRNGKPLRHSSRTHVAMIA